MPEPCSTWLHPAFAAAIAEPSLCACTSVRRPWALASPHAAFSCSSVMRLRAALADALRGEDLDEVGALRLLLADVGAKRLLDVARALVHRAERRQDARPGQLAAGDGVAQVLVARGAGALHGGEAVHQRDVGVLGARQRHLGRRLALVLRPAVLAEVVADVDVDVDQPGHQRDVARGRRSPARCARSTRHDLAVARSRRCRSAAPPPFPSSTRAARTVIGVAVPAPATRCGR